MKYVPIMLAAIGMIAVGGASHAAQDTTLYTAPTRAGAFHCDVVNVSQKPLNITISIVDGTVNPPNVLNTPVVAQTAMPGEEVNGDFTPDPKTPTDAYCVIQVSGTGDRNDIRGALSITLARTYTLGGVTYTALLTRVFEAH